MSHRLVRLVAPVLLACATLQWGDVGTAQASENVRGGMGATSGNADITGNARAHGQDRKRVAQVKKVIAQGPRVLSPREVMCTYGPPLASLALPVAGLSARAACAGPALARAGDPANTPAPAEQAQTVARDYVRTLSMPAPQPRMSAPQGVCGARHWVELGVPGSMSFAPEQTSFGPLQATAHGTFTVDWGDGTVERIDMTSAASTTVSHTWPTAGNFDITINATWTLDWRLGGFSGVVEGLTTSGAVTDWPVIEAQAVLVR